MLNLGITLFVGGHLIPAVPGMRDRLVESIGDNGVKGLVSLASLVGLGLIVWGWGDGPMDAFWAPPPWTRHVAWLAVPTAFVMLVAAYVPSRIGWFLGHPMSLAVAVWGTAHLFANHELRSVLLFGAMALWGVIGWLLAGKRDGFRPKPRPERPRNAVVVLVGLLLAGATMGMHGWLFGVPVIP